MARFLFSLSTWSKYTQNRKERNPRRVAIIKPLFSNVFSKSQKTKKQGENRTNRHSRQRFSKENQKKLAPGVSQKAGKDAGRHITAGIKNAARQEIAQQERRPRKTGTKRAENKAGKQAERNRREEKTKREKQGRKSNDKKEIPRTNRYGGFSMLKLRRVSA
uniref:hypothetical protein n=1 Tax=Bifidobacterium adolescentis TaxID=1680 RepID=UPI003FEF11B9